jgi:hypothetical protein
MAYPGIIPAAGFRDAGWRSNTIEKSRRDRNSLPTLRLVDAGLGRDAGHRIRQAGNQAHSHAPYPALRRRAQNAADTENSTVLPAIDEPFFVEEKFGCK